MTLGGAGIKQQKRNNKSSTIKEGTWNVGQAITSTMNHSQKPFWKPLQFTEQHCHMGILGWTHFQCCVLDQLKLLDGLQGQSHVEHDAIAQMSAFLYYLYL